MAKLLYSVTMSLDGFIAGPSGDMSWLTSYLGPDPYVDGLIDHIGALLVGGRTYPRRRPLQGDRRRGAGLRRRLERAAVHPDLQPAGGRNRRGGVRR